MEPLFNDYLCTFFDDEGMPKLAATIRNGIYSRMPFDLVRDLKKALSPNLYKGLVDNSFSYAPPYLPLYGFTHYRDNPHVLSRTKLITAMDWEDSETQTAFRDYVKTYYEKGNDQQVVKALGKWLLQIKAEANTKY